MPRKNPRPAAKKARKRQKERAAKSKRVGVIAYPPRQLNPRYAAMLTAAFRATGETNDPCTN